MNGAHNEFAAGTTYTDTTTVTNTNGTTQVLTVQIAGTNDAAVIAGTTTASISETDVAQTVSGQLVVTDVDNPSIPAIDNLVVIGLDSQQLNAKVTDGITSVFSFTAQSGLAGNNGYGTFSINASGLWTYTMNSAHNEFVAGQLYSDTATVTSIDGTPQDISVTILGTNDAAVISPTVSHLTQTNDILSASGHIDLTDIDSAALLNAGTFTGIYGSLTVTADGNWTYVTSTAHKEFAANQTYVDSFTVTSSDGTSGSLQVNILGTNDAAVIQGTSPSLSKIPPSCGSPM
jgi:VCBS repeat-containing protein